MLTRIATSASLSAAITAATLLLMNSLIDIGPAVLQDVTPRIPVGFVRLIKKEVVVTTDQFEQPTRTLQPPPQVFRQPTDSRTDGAIGVRSALPAPEMPPVSEPGLYYSSNALVSIIKVQPNYPARAAANGIEGYVTVRFDVTPLGTVDNVVVIDSSNALFHRAAINAALRFRYRPPIVDGEPQSVRGVTSRFVFHMED